MFYVTDVAYNDAGTQRTLAISGMDAAGMLGKSRLVEPYQIAAGTNIGTALSAWVTHHMPAAVVNVGTTARTSTGAMYLVSDDTDPVTVATQLCALAGWVFWVGRDGEFMRMSHPMTRCTWGPRRPRTRSRPQMWRRTSWFRPGLTW